MIKKVKYTLIDTELLPAELICRNSSFEQFVGIDDRFSSEWVNLTTRLNNIKGQIMKQFDTSSPNSCNTARKGGCGCSSGQKSDLFFSFNNKCGLILVE